MSLTEKLTAWLWFPVGGKLKYIVDSQDEWEIEDKSRAIPSLWNDFVRQIGPRHAGKVENKNAAWAGVLNDVVEKVGTGFIVGLVGPRGTGKTQLSAFAARAFIERMIGEAVYVTLNGLLVEVRGSFDKDSKTSEQAIVRRYSTIPFLIVDELQEAKDSEFTSQTFTSIMDARYRNKKDTILISNLETDAFSKAVGSSVASRMQECGGIVKMAWKSFRTKT